MNQPIRPLGTAQTPKPNDRSRSMDAVEASKGLAVSMGDQVESASQKVGEQAAPYIYQRSMKGFLTGLSAGFDTAKSPFEGFELSPDEDFFTFPQVGEAQPHQSLGSSSLGQKALSAQRKD